MSGRRHHRTAAPSNGSTIERQHHRTAEFTLSDAQLCELTDVMCRIEEIYEKPTDIEWAFAGGQLHVLQARPITTYVPLPPEMMTKPGERRRLYMDSSLSKGMTMNAPISPMGLNWMEEIFSGMIESFVGPLKQDDSCENSLTFFGGGRMYGNLSNVLWLASPKRLSKGNAANDALMAEILANVDAKRYRAAKRPPWVGLRILWLVPRILWRSRGLFKKTLAGIFFPKRTHRIYQRATVAFEAEFTENIDLNISLDDFRRKYLSMVVQTFDISLSAFLTALIALGSVDLVVRKKSANEAALAEKLKMGFTGNMVVEMGIALFRLAKQLDRAEPKDQGQLAERIENRQMSAEFLSSWDTFISRFGCRGPLEMDLASPRYADDIGLTLRQMSFMTVDDESFDPEAAHERQVGERRQAYDELMSRSGWLRRLFLRRIHLLIELFAGTRDTPKHHNVILNYAVRKRTLIEGQNLVKEGRLDAASDVFDLTFHDLESATQFPTLDLRKIREERTHFLKILEAQVTEFPMVIDSRGRILRPPLREERPGELSGTAVSPGRVAGPVKVLHDPHSKQVNKGDILVAYTTDPGWTPLFVSAAAIVLEVGGVLQHGAVIAREYGKPCVVGIDRVMKKLHDGQMVEVDGTAGIIRLL